MIVKGMTGPGRGIMSVTHRGGTPTVIATTAEEAAAVLTVAAAAVVGARIALEIGKGIGTENGTTIKAGVCLKAKLGREAGVEVRTA